MADGENQFSFQGIYLLIRNQVIPAIQAISGGGSGGTALTKTEVVEALQEATTLDQLEGYVDQLESYLTPRQYTSSPTSLTAPGNTAALDCSATTGELFWIITFDVASIDTSVIMQGGGTIDGQAVVLGPPMTITTNGSHAIQGPVTPLDDFFLTFVSESGGTAAVIQNIKLRARGRGV